MRLGLGFGLGLALGLGLGVRVRAKVRRPGVLEELSGAEHGVGRGLGW